MIKTTNSVNWVIGREDMEITREDFGEKMEQRKWETSEWKAIEEEEGKDGRVGKRGLGRKVREREREKRVRGRERR